jgi:hypothetical protein
LVLEIVGHRHYVQRLKTSLTVGETLELVPEPQNPVDVNAIAVKVRGETIGYVNRLQTAAFHQWLRDGVVRASLERLNGATDRPRAFMFVQLRSADKAAA